MLPKELTKPAQFAHRALGVATAQKNKINSYSVLSLVGFEKVITLELDI
jgi:hypothetical protein